MEDYKCIDSCSMAANYAKADQDGNIIVMTIYRYGKTVYKIYNKDEFIAWRNDVDKTKEITLEDLA